MAAKSRMTHVDTDTVASEHPMDAMQMVHLPAQAELKRWTKDGMPTLPLIAWAVVRHRFTDIDDVSFGVHDISSDKSTEEKTGREDCICRVSIDPEAQVGDFLSGNRHKFGPFGIESPAELDTSILFHRGKDLETLGGICHSLCDNYVRIY